MWAKRERETKTMGDDQHIAQDMHSYFYPNGMSRWDKFFEYVLPWLILLGIVVGLYLMMMYGLQVIMILSEPLAEGLKKAGL